LLRIVGDFHPLEVDHGQIASFFGCLCRHHAPPNLSQFTRVSLDFRVGVGGYFDPEWRPEGVKALHGWREVTL
jgi:hypothetical protein